MLDQVCTTTTPRHDTAFAPSAVRYVKLGQGGAWTAAAIAENILPFGFRGIADADCREGNWDGVREQFVTAGRSAAGASQGVRELRDVYELDANCLWVTIADGHLYWAFAGLEVVPVVAAADSDFTRYRRTRDAWSRTSLADDPLTTRSLSSALLRTASYRMTICKVDRQDYLLRRIRGEPDPLHLEAVDLQAQQEALAARMTAQLDWRDFETLVDLILTRSGWRRGSNVGDGEVDVDLMLDNPSTGETAWVQVKSSASQKTLDDYVERFERDGSAERLYFVCHSPTGVLTMPPGPARHLWTGTALAAVTIRAGLFDWLIERTR